MIAKTSTSNSPCHLPGHERDRQGPLLDCRCSNGTCEPFHPRLLPKLALCVLAAITHVITPLWLCGWRCIEKTALQQKDSVLEQIPTSRFGFGGLVPTLTSFLSRHQYCWPIHHSKTLPDSLPLSKQSNSHPRELPAGCMEWYLQR